MSELIISLKVKSRGVFLLVKGEKACSLPKSTSIESDMRVFRDDLSASLFFDGREVEGYSWKKLMDIEEFTEGHGGLVLLALAKLYSFMPNSIKGKEEFIPKEILGDIPLGEVTFYGGSFNPWHEGHSECVRQCRDRNLIVVPDSNPWKERASIRICRWKSFIELVHRFGDNASFYPGFWKMKQSNPTVDWFPKVKIEKKNLLMGDDNFMSIEKWTRSKELLDSVDTLYVVPRLESLYRLDQKKKSVLKDNDLNIEILSEHSYQSLSSTEIRNK